MPDHYPQPHCNSYYAATANVTTDYPQLRGASSCDVCIIGAGFTGISAALHLAERGYKVSVLESNRVSWGASGRNGGQLIGGISGEERLKKFVDKDDSELLWKMRWAGHEIIKQRVDKYAIDCDLKFGYMDVAIKARHWRALEEEYESLTDDQVNEINPLDLAVCDPNHVLDYFRLSADKRLLFGGR